MREWRRKRRNVSELKLIHPNFAIRFVLLLRRMEARGWRPRMQGTWRHPDQQLIEFYAGRSRVRGPVAPHTGTIQVQPASLATHMYNDDDPLGEAPRYWAELAIEAMYLGLQTGVLWGLDDRAPHEDALENGHVRVLTSLLWIRRGWDPLHVEDINWRTNWGDPKATPFHKEKA